MAGVADIGVHFLEDKFSQSHMKRRLLNVGRIFQEGMWVREWATVS